jgi:hypothetical protein
VLLSISACGAKPGTRQGSKWIAQLKINGKQTRLGKTVQVYPFKPTLKAPGTKRLKLKYDEPFSKIAFKFNLRRYTWVHS